MQVYVVDDDAAVLRSCAILLQAHGHSAIPCESAEAFLEVYDRSKEACLVLDLRMPGMSGLELQAHLKDQGMTLPIIMLTGHGDVPAAVKALKNGAIDFIEKPADEASLLSALSEARAVLRNAPRRSVPKTEVDSRLKLLTSRERDVLDHLVLGKINKEIAENLGISQRTVEIHRARVREKMQARGISDLIMMLRD
ncbi:MAG: response regulator [Pseudomonadota bacterium]